MQPASDAATTLVIFGATGDLARRKLLPALFHLFSNGYLPEKFRVLGLSRDEMSSEDFREFARGVIAKKSHSHRDEELEEFLGVLEYHAGEFGEAGLYQEIGEHLSNLDEEIFRDCSNKLFYLAVPPVAYDEILNNLAKSGLSIPCGGADGWTRVLIEKPFGRDLETAQELDAKLGKLFQEEQIFRIDHYLAKETVQNIITFRFANSIFEPVWDHEDVAEISIKVHEKIGVGERASFYEDNGALRDVGQNHILQLLALVTMEDPKELEAGMIRNERAKVLEKLMPATEVVRGQYRGYRQEKDVGDESETETYFKLTTGIDNERWHGVPIYLESGKKMAENKVEIKVIFKEPMSCVCPEDDQHHRNELTIRVQPDEGITLKFWAKRPGFKYELEPRELSFFYKAGPMREELPDAYERVLFDCIRGDQTLFASTDEVSAAWKFITPILESWKDAPLLEYEAASGVVK